MRQTSHVLGSGNNSSLKSLYIRPGLVLGLGEGLRLCLFFIFWHLARRLTVQHSLSNELQREWHGPCFENVTNAMKAYVKLDLNAQRHLKTAFSYY